MAEVGTVYITVLPEMSKFSAAAAKSARSAGAQIGKETASGISSGTGSGFGKVGDMLKSAAGTAVKAAGAAATAVAGTVTAATAATAKQAFDAYKDYEQLVGGVETLFGTRGASSLQDYAKLVGKTTQEASADFQAHAKAQEQALGNAQSAYRTCGLSANQYMETATSFAASLVSSLNGDTVAAVAAADTAMVDMSDNANKMGTDISRIQDAYQGFAKQNFTMLDNLKLGYGGTKTEMERLLQDAERIKAANGETVDYSIDKFSDVVEAIHVVQESMGITGTTAEEASKTISGSIGMAQAAWGNFVTELGKDKPDFKGVTDDLLFSLDAVAQNVIPRVQAIATNIIQQLPSILSTIAGYIPPLMIPLLDAAINTIITSLNGMLAKFGVKIPPFDTKAAFDALGKFVSKVGEVAGKALSFFVELGKSIGRALDNPTTKGAFETIGNAFQRVGDVFSRVWGQMSPHLTHLAETLLPHVANAFAFVVDIVSMVVGVLAELAGGIVEAADAFVSWLDSLPTFGEMWQGLVDTIKGAWDGVVEFVAGVWEGIKSAIQTAMDSISATVSTVWSAISTTIGTVLGAIKSVVETVWNAIKAVIEVVLGAIAAWIQMEWEGIKTVTTTVWNLIKGVVETVWNAIKTVVTTAVNAVKTTLDNVWNSIKSTASTVWNAIKSTISGIWDGIKSAVSGAVNSVKSTLDSVWGNIKSAVSETWSNVKSTISSTWDNIKSNVSEKVNAVKNSISEGWSSLTGKVGEIFGSVRDKISEKLDAARQAVSEAISRISGIITGANFTLPHIKLPHFSISGSFSLNPPSIPHVSVAWYANGGIFGGGMFNSPQMIGVGDGPGYEAVFKMNDRNLGLIGDAIAQHTGDGHGEAKVSIVIEQFNNYTEQDVDDLGDRLAARVEHKLYSKGVAG